MFELFRTPVVYRLKTILSTVIITCVFLGPFISCNNRNPLQETGILKAGTPLDQYVQVQDTAFRAQIMYHAKLKGYTFYVLKMVSQHWLTASEVDKPEWWHWIKVVIPDSVRDGTALMWIGGGASDDELPQEAGELLTRSALLTGTVTAEVHNIPNQPLTFRDDTVSGRYEDELIAYGWRKFLEGGARDEDAVWLARLPMTKAVVRAMDAVQEMAADEAGLKIEHFVVSGASKRGWTTWTTAAVDDRVIAIVPVVIDLLNLEPSFEHHWKNYGFWAPAVADYVNEGIMEWMRSSEFHHLLEITEPFSYADRYDMPKLLINAAGDQFFQPDSWQFYWDGLIGEKHLRYVPNTGHSLRGTDAIETLISFYDAVISHDPRPDYSWVIKEGEIQVRTDPEDPPSSIRLWTAVNTSSRDFRIDKVGEIWNDSLIPVHPAGVYNIPLSEPEKGWKGNFVELTFPGKVPLKVTTGITIIPKIYPFEPFVSEDPQGVPFVP